MDIFCKYTIFVKSFSFTVKNKTSRYLCLLRLLSKIKKFFTLTEMVHEKTVCSTFKRLDHSIFNPIIEKNRLSYV